MVAQSLRFMVEAQQNGGMEQWVQNLMAETITVHGRLLEDFFDNKRTKQDSAIVADYILDDRAANRRWRKMKRRVGRSPFPRERINREIVHLSYLRIYGNPPEKRWRPGPFVDWLGRSFLALFLVVNPNRFPSPLVQRYSDLFSALGVVLDPSVDPNNDSPPAEPTAEMFSMFG